MQMFTTSEQYKSIIADFKRKNKSLVQNCYYMFDEVKKLIEEKRLYYTVTEDALLIFRDEGKYYHVAFMVSKEFKKIQMNAVKPCITGVVNKGDEESPKVTECRNMAERLGFSFIHCNRMYVINVSDRLSCLQDEYMELSKNLEQLGIVRRSYEDCYFSKIKELWEDYLVEFNIPKEDWEIHIKDSVLIVDTGSGNELCGVIMPKMCSNDNIRHLVVNPLYWDKNLSMFLFYSVLEVLRENGFKTANTWIADDNIFSIKCQKKYLHIKDTGLKSYQYIMQK